MKLPRSSPAFPLVAAVALIASLCGAPATALAPYRVPRPEARKLANGLRVVVFSDPRQPVVEVQLRVPAGMTNEPAGQNGVASVTARMLGLGTTSRSAESFARDLGLLGAGLSADAGREYTTISSVFLSRDFEGGLELVADAVARPVFLDDQFRRALNLVGRGVLQVHQNPPATAVEQLWTLALPDAPVAQPPLGRIETLGRLTLDQVRTYYRAHYRPSDAVLAIAGDVTPERAYAAAQEWLGSWPGGEGAPAPAAAPRKPGAGRVRVVDQPGAATVALAVGVLVPGRSSADALARSVAVSLFEQQLVDHVARGGVRDVSASLELTRDVGLWVVQAAAPADSALVLARRLIAELKRYVAAPSAAADVAAAQHRIRRGYPLAFETGRGLLNQWQLADFSGFPADYFDGYDARVAALGPQDLQSAARREADAERPYLVAVGPASRVAPLLSSIAPAEVVTLDRMPGASLPADTLGPHSAEDATLGRKLIAQAVTAHGGRAKLAAVKTSLADANLKFTIPGGELSGTIRQLRKEPDKLAVVSSVRGVDTRQVLNGTRAWTVIAESDTAQEGDSLDVASLRVQFLSDLPHVLLSASDERARVAARGRESVAGRDADKVEVVSGRDSWRMLYFDATTHRLLAFDQREHDERGAFMARRVLSDYRPLDGIQWPYKEERFVSGQSLMTLDYMGVQLNLELEEKQFLPPKTITPWR